MQLADGAQAEFTEWHMPVSGGTSLITALRGFRSGGGGPRGGAEFSQQLTLLWELTRRSETQKEGAFRHPLMGGGGDSHRRGNTHSHRPHCLEDVVDDRRLMHFTTLCLAGFGLRFP